MFHFGIPLLLLVFLWFCQTQTITIECLFIGRPLFLSFFQLCKYNSLRAGGPSFPMDMTWGRLILLSLSKKRPKNTFQAQVVQTTGD